MMNMEIMAGVFREGVKEKDIRVDEDRCARIIVR